MSNSVGSETKRPYSPVVCVIIVQGPYSPMGCVIAAPLFFVLHPNLKSVVLHIYGKNTPCTQIAPNHQKAAPNCPHTDQGDFCRALRACTPGEVAHSCAWLRQDAPAPHTCTATHADVVPALVQIPQQNPIFCRLLDKAGMAELRFEPSHGGCRCAPHQLPKLHAPQF